MSKRKNIFGFTIIAVMTVVLICGMLTFGINSAFAANNTKNCLMNDCDNNMHCDEREHCDEHGHCETQDCYINVNKNSIFISENSFVLGRASTAKDTIEPIATWDQVTECFVCGCPVKNCNECYEEQKGTDESITGYKVICTSSKHASGKYEGLSTCPNYIINQTWYTGMMSVTDIIDSLMTPILIILGTAGAVFVIVLSVNYSKAESADKREESKKRLIHATIGIVVMIIALVLVKLFTANAGQIMLWINRQS